MQRWTEELERRATMRTSQRLACEVWAGGDRHEGVLEQVSESTVVVRLDELPRAAGPARVMFSTPDGTAIVLRTMSEKPRPVPYGLRDLLPPSIVMHVLEPPDPFLRWVGATLPSAP